MSLDVTTGRKPSHGAYARPTRSKRARKHRRRYVALLIEGHPEQSTREQILIGLTADAMLRANDINSSLDQGGVIVDGQPAPVLKIYLSLLNTIRRNLETLGLRPDVGEAERTPGLREYREGAIDAEGDESSDSADQDAQGAAGDAIVSESAIATVSADDATGGAHD